MSGADLANVTNEGALMAARQGKKKIDFSDFNKVKSEIIFFRVISLFLQRILMEYIDIEKNIKSF